MSVVHVNGRCVNPIIFRVSPDEFNVHRIECVRNADYQPELVTCNVEDGTIVSHEAY
jgi:hypothetical protein